MASTTEFSLFAEGQLDELASVLTPAQLKLIEGGAAIRQDPENVQWAFMARQLVQCTLPHSNPGDLPAWSRRNGNLVLGIRPGWNYEKNCSYGYPYGSIPRLLLFWIVTEAKVTQSRRLHLGSNLAQFMRDINLSPDTGGGKRGDAKRLRDQMRRLFRSTISFQQSTSPQVGLQGEQWLDMQVAPEGELWWDAHQPEQATLWDSWIELGEKFYQAILSAPVPLDMRALKHLKRSPLALDVYAVMNYRAHTAKAPVFFSWSMLMKQFGTETADTKDFKKQMLPALRKVLAVQPHLHIERERGGVIVHPSRAAIGKKAI